MTEFNAPIEINFANPAAIPAIPAWSQVGTSAAPAWTNMGRLDGSTLPATRPDGFHGNTAAVNVLTHHLTFFGLKVDDGPPTPPRHIAGVVASDGLDAPLDPRHRRERRSSATCSSTSTASTTAPSAPASSRRRWDRSRPATAASSRSFSSTQPGTGARTARSSAPSRRSSARASTRRSPHSTAAGFAARHGARGAGRDGRARHRRRPDRSRAHGSLSTKIDLVVSRELHRAADAARLHRRRLEDARPEEADDDRRSGQGVQARHA